MRYSSTIVALLLCSIALCYAQDPTTGTCSASATVTYIADSAVSNTTTNRTSAQYRVTLTNTGQCTLQQVLLSLSLTAGGNYEDGVNASAVIGGYFSILGFGASLVPGASYSGASIRVSYPIPSYPQDVTVRGAFTECLTGCQAPSTAAVPCGVRTNAQYRDDSIAIDGEGRFIADYDIYVDNIGTCAITDVAVDPVIPTGVAVISTTGLEGTRGGYLVTSYGASLAPKTTALASIRLAFTASGYAQSLATVVYGNNCAGCDAATPAPSTDAPATPAPSTEAPATPAPSTPAPATTCSSTSAVSLREGSTWTDGNGVRFGVFDVLVSNTGKCTLAVVQLNIEAPADAEITQTWNLQKNTEGAYALMNFYEIPAGRSFNGAGMIVSFKNGKDVASTFGATVKANGCSTTCTA